ncbi:hypothetical protein [Streptomyces sp. Wb2n-11]|uniref:hypothetical protein n=1 Tax=Streptomyces sp. Wb2n-11 TaxID=1030533 RepID=UPI000A52C28F|nr:hypothetical protein [Streptomyces sp. Wb2n-11]
MRYRPFVVFSLLAALLGAGFALVWIAATGEYRPPIWVTCLAAIGTGWVADVLEQALARRHTRKARAHVEGPKPTNPDGTPYGYHQIRAFGWEHCDGCHKWGQTWTPENPHECRQTYTKGPVA